jgi:hypothetical protein
MKINFLSARPAALKVDGVFLGTIDSYERQIDGELSDEKFVEIIPYGPFHPVCFLLNGCFLKAPPATCAVYADGLSVLIEVRHFIPNEQSQKILWQTVFGGYTVTLMRQGRMFLAVEGASYELHELPSSFFTAPYREVKVAGYPFLCVHSGDWLLLLSREGKVAFLQEADTFEVGQTLLITTRFKTCAGLVAKSEYGYGKGTFTLKNTTVIPQTTPTEQCLPFAFFEAVLYGADLTPYATPSLTERQTLVKSYLGEYVRVMVPSTSFYKRHPQSKAVGLAYATSQNTFQIKYFSVEILNGKVDNILQVE